MTTTLLLGATGMLKAAASHAAWQAEECVLVSRNAGVFSFGNAALDARLIRLSLSYEDEPAFLGALADYAPFDLALTWIRPRAELLRAALDALIAPGGLLVEVMGSRSILTGESGAPSIAALRAEVLAHQPDITYAQVILGFVHEGKNSRWLDHEEISAAAIAQMEMPLPRRIAGTLEPWDERPH
ncbi:MAG: hypothetical protein Q7V31_13480 [Parvibaculum sp.]|uniref:hypothetical protein n=1 Tax=Parvibaculum sp. TaxID=2024848 RepID=UPI002718B2EC|nr:hypothetical protein [Parvibaculum sp.]MDO8839930.1 hypothetical protein [Parvibaculum sp.]